MSEQQTSASRNRIPPRPRERQITRTTFDQLAAVMRDITAQGEEGVLAQHSFLRDQLHVDASGNTPVVKSRSLVSSREVLVPEHVAVEDLSAARKYIRIRSARHVLAEALSEPPQLHALAEAAIQTQSDENEKPLPTYRLVFEKDGPGVRFSGEVALYEDAQRGHVFLECLGTSQDETLTSEVTAFADGVGLQTIWQRYAEQGLLDTIGIYDEPLSQSAGYAMLKALQPAVDKPV